MHPQVASDLATQHRYDMTARAARAGRAASAGSSAPAIQATPPARVTPAVQAGPHRGAASPRVPRRIARRAHLPGALLPRYRVSWSRTTLSAAGGDGRRARSLVIVISASRGL